MVEEEKGDLYDGRKKEHWMNGLKEMDLFNIKHLLITFAYFGIPESMLDVGCGTGIMVKTAQKMGVRAYGLDQLVDEKDKETWPDGFYHLNLVDFWSGPEPVDIVFCIEVAEHIHEDGHATLCRTLCENLKEGPNHHIIFSAARPGQLGFGHCSLRPAEYWHNEMIVNHVGYNREATMNLALLYSNTNSSLNYFWNNLIIFST